MTPKYPTEFFLAFRSVDRFLFRISDLRAIGELPDQGSLDRLDDCHIYLLGKRPRLSLVPTSIRASDEAIEFTVEYKLEGSSCHANVGIPRRLFAHNEKSFEASPYPHRDLISRDAEGKVVAQTWVSNFVHLMPSVLAGARDMEIVYVGKGLRRSAKDRLLNHETLQGILAEINSHEPDAEVFALVYAFECHNNAVGILAMPAEISGDAAKQHGEKAVAYRPSLDEQVSLIEASIISYFRPEKFNAQYLDFPDRKQQILNRVYDADLAAITVQLDNTNIGGQRTYSKTIKPQSTHHIIVDFRRLEGKYSPFENVTTDNSS
jgi:hypothetical protein